MNTVPVDFAAIAPEMTLVGAAGILLCGLVFLPRQKVTRPAAVLATLAYIGAGIAAGALYTNGASYAFDHTLRMDSFGEVIRIIVFAAGFLTMATSWGLGDVYERALEYYTLVLVAGAGMSLLAVANSFVILFVALELFSIALYILVAIAAEHRSSLEGGLKYLIVGSVGAALILYGAALVYGSTGQLEFDRIRQAAAAGDAHAPLLLTGIALVLAGLGFKANAAPFHMWTPDAYEGAPTPITGFMSGATKAVALATILRVLVSAFPGQTGVWQSALGALAIASFAIGNLAALRQSNVKRMLAYSTVGHTGFLLTAVAADNDQGARALLYYLTVYAAMNLGAFAVVAVREREIGRAVDIADFSGWGYRRPALAGAMFIFLLSLAGFPPTGGFLGKLYIFSAAIKGGQTYLAVAGVIATMAALIYYLRIPLAMYGRDLAVPEARTGAGWRLASLATAASAIVVLGAGIFPAPLITFATHAGNSLPFG